MELKDRHEDRHGILKLVAARNPSDGSKYFQGVLAANKDKNDKTPSIVLKVLRFKALFLF